MTPDGTIIRGWLVGCGRRHANGLPRPRIDQSAAQALNISRRSGDDHLYPTELRAHVENTSGAWISKHWATRQNLSGAICGDLGGVMRVGLIRFHGSQRPPTTPCDDISCRHSSTGPVWRYAAGLQGSAVLCGSTLLLVRRRIAISHALTPAIQIPALAAPCLGGCSNGGSVWGRRGCRSARYGRFAARPVCPPTVRTTRPDPAGSKFLAPRPSTTSHPGRCTSGS